MDGNVWSCHSSVTRGGAEGISTLVRPGKKRAGKSAVEVDVETEQQPAEASPSQDFEDSPLYGVAMLKVAMELKKQDSRALDEILRGVLSKMDLSEAQFRKFLTQNAGLLRTIAQKKAY